MLLLSLSVIKQTFTQKDKMQTTLPWECNCSAKESELMAGWVLCEHVAACEVHGAVESAEAEKLRESKKKSMRGAVAKVLLETEVSDAEEAEIEKKKTDTQ